MADNSTSLTEDKLNQLTQELTFKFRNHALKYGWDFDVVSQIKVVWNENGISFDYPPSISSKVEALEYGENNSPSRAILTFQNSIGPEIVERFISILEDSLIDNGVFG